MSDLTPHSGTIGSRLVDTLLDVYHKAEWPPLGVDGTPVDETLAALAAKKDGDVPWENGQLFGLVHDGGPTAREVAERAAVMFLHENMLKPLAFPSLGEIQEELTQWTVRLLHGPEGAIDTIPAIAELAKSVGASCHVDACMGGHVLPFAERLGQAVPPWDFRVDGVDSISADHHKLGYALKGVSTVLYRSADRAARQVWDLEWSGGYYATLTLLGSRSAASMSAAWAVMRHLGLSGYERLVDTVLTNCDRMRDAVNDVRAGT